MEIGILVIVSLLIGGVFSWLFCQKKYTKNLNAYLMEIDAIKSKLQSAEINLEIASEKTKDLNLQLEEIRKDKSRYESENIRLNAQLAEKTTDQKHLFEKLESQKKDLESLQERFNLEFRNLANAIMEEKSKKFTQQNQEQLDRLLKPLGEKIRDFEKKVETAYEKESQQRFSLKEEVKRLAELNQTVSKEARELTQALKGQVKTQGSWGEMILETILDRSGLTKNREYFVQQSFTNEDGRRLQPDVVIAYPGNKNVVIDSKVSLTAYEKYSSTEEMIIREQALKEHLLSVKKHIDELAAKNYQHLYSLNSLDFVMMFMPVEPAFMLAVEYDNNLWSYAYERGILLIGPTNLIAALKMVASLWQQEYQSRNVIEIARESGKLYDKFVGFVDDLQKVGVRLQAARESYDQTLNKLRYGRGNLVSRVEKIRKLGARTSKELPNAFKDTTDEE